MKVMGFVKYYEEQSKKIIKDIIINNITKKKKDLLECINSKNINSPSIKEIESIINKFNIEYSLEEIIPKILEEDNVFASFFYGKPQITPTYRGNIIKKYLEKFNVIFTTTTPSVNLKKYSLYYLGEYQNKEVYYYLLDKNKPSTHNEVLQRVKMLEKNVEYQNCLIIFDDVINGGEVNKNFPNLYNNPNITNIKSLTNE
tara:strand:- start:809 stop:1408 length:600 start_codon:yes stop_codon:yes gene_type:complete